ncbi:related to cell division control protein CDC36 [Cephalotrichum gorgonifer]|uniref:Related to cell division control protein CDC36 n=1 Tax=Cephalotrichum gorgonifer TaxID=2041049 RepID=A0AAE8MTM4_9PEZI|nr:related to cell division control protein CDC36 [Cephalotrichum gorgonifer]
MPNDRSFYSWFPERYMPWARSHSRRVEARYRNRSVVCPPALEASNSLNHRGAPSRPQDTEAPAGSDGRQKAAGFREGSITTTEGSPELSESRNPLGAIGNVAPSASKAKQDEEPAGPEIQDPLAGMPPADKWGLKGLRTLMNNYPDYNAMVLGIDPNSLGLDLASSEPISTQIYSLFDDQPPRPAIPHFRLPECYHVKNVGPIETKISNFNEDTLFFIFYANAGDVTQHLAAQELHARSWRWHKKLQIWLTKDEHMMPQQISPTVERGFYIIWDPIRFQRDRREFTLHYGDLDTSLAQGAQ